MTYCVGSEIAAFAAEEGLNLAAIPKPGQVNAASTTRASPPSFGKPMRDSDTVRMTIACTNASTPRPIV